MGIILIFHVAGLQFLEKKCLILPPPSKKEVFKRPAAYLLRIVVNLAILSLLAPAIVKFHAPNMMRGVQATLFSSPKSLQVISPDEPPTWVCAAETITSELIFVNFLFEMVFAFRMKQNSHIICHHCAGIMIALARLTHLWDYFGFDWVWQACSFHAFVYVANFIRPCYSFVTHFVVDSSRDVSPSLRSLFRLANSISWVAILSGYFAAALFAAYNGDFMGGAVSLLTVAPLFYGSRRNFFRSFHEITRGSNLMRMLSVLIFEILVGLFLAPCLLLMDYGLPVILKRFLKSSSHKNTAGGVVSLRALCNAESDTRLHVEDPYAILFIGSALSRLIAKSAVLRHLMYVKLESEHPGALGNLITRTHTIDEVIEDLTVNRHNNPISQFVILGAGYDTRAYRLGKTLSNVTVFEVDQHFMSSEKQQKCMNLAPVCHKLIHLCTDFNTEKVSNTLLQCPDFDPSLPTFFLWEGVQVYLPDSSVDEMFANLREILATSAKDTNTAETAEHYLYFTFSDKLIMDSKNRKNIYGGEEFFYYAQGIGERVRSGIDPNNLKEYLAQRGCLLYDYFPRTGLSGHMTPNEKQSHYLSHHPFVKQSEVFHSCLAQIV